MFLGRLDRPPFKYCCSIVRLGVKSEGVFLHVRLCLELDGAYVACVRSVLVVHHLDVSFQPILESKLCIAQSTYMRLYLFMHTSYLQN